ISSFFDISVYAQKGDFVTFRPMAISRFSYRSPHPLLYHMTSRAEPCRNQSEKDNKPDNSVELSGLSMAEFITMYSFRRKSVVSVCRPCLKDFGD
ncbi:MAG: hypothetical protein II634_04125, partial [Lachnospiraceae bacterium]|nr:hypothetical protein [Lachnospiraceae bacterium]